MSNTLAAITARRAELTQSIKDRNAAFKTFTEESKKELSRLDTNERLLLAGLDVDRLERARKILFVQGDVNSGRRQGDCHQGIARADAVNDARNDLVDGCKRLASRYMGVKNYGGFGDQREDHEYGMGPRHGSTVFSLGLMRDVRDRLNSGDTLSNDELENALYLLASLSVVSKLQTAAEPTPPHTAWR